jgi:Zn-dependent protease
VTERLPLALLDVLIFWMLTTPHEFAHAWVATRLGDDTPRRDGRVTLNPMAHVDWMGTVILPLVTSLLGGGFLGWGRPVMTDPRKLRGGNLGMAAVALAGPFCNILFAGVVVLLANAVPSAVDLFFRAVYLSIFLALFNLIPLPPLDGSKVLLAAGFPVRWYIEVARYGFLLLMVLFYSTGLGHMLSRATMVGTAALFRIFLLRG